MAVPLEQSRGQNSAYRSSCQILLFLIGCESRGCTVSGLEVVSDDILWTAEYVGDT